MSAETASISRDFHKKAYRGLACAHRIKSAKRPWRHRGSMVFKRAQRTATLANCGSAYSKK